jgi:16S rRNA processing protein RimM
MHVSTVLTMATPDSPHSGAPEDLVELGRVVSAFGVRGWIKVQPHSPDSQTLLAAKIWWFKPHKTAESAAMESAPFPISVVSSRTHGATVVAQLDTITDRDDAQALKAHTVWIPRSGFPQAADDEYYWVDLIGCRLFGRHEGVPALIGKVLGVADNGAHAILRVARASANDSGGVDLLQNAKGAEIEVLVPFVAAHVQSVDLANKRIDTDWPLEF